MKLFLILTLLLSSSAFAATPLLVKSSGAGFTAPQFIRSESCELFADHVTITHYYGGRGIKGAFNSVETRQVVVSDSIRDAIAQMATEKLESTPNGLCDGPSTSIYAPSADGKSEEVTLFSTGGCGSPRKERTGASSSALRDLIDRYCARTVDFAKQPQDGH